MITLSGRLSLANTAVSRETPFFLWTVSVGVSEIRTKICGFTCFLEQELETCGGFIDTEGFLVEWEAIHPATVASSALPMMIHGESTFGEQLLLEESTLRRARFERRALQ